MSTFDLFDLHIISRFAIELLLTEEVSAGARCLQVVVREERGVLTGEDTLGGRHVAGLAWETDSLAAATQSQGQDRRGVRAGAAGGNTEAGRVQAGGDAGLAGLAPSCGAALTSLRGAHCVVTAGQTDLTEGLHREKHIISLSSLSI